MQLLYLLKQAKKNLKSYQNVDKLYPNRYLFKWTVKKWCSIFSSCKQADSYDILNDLKIMAEKIFSNLGTYIKTYLFIQLSGHRFSLIWIPIYEKKSHWFIINHICHYLNQDRLKLIYLLNFIYELWKKNILYLIRTSLSLKQKGVLVSSWSWVVQAIRGKNLLSLTCFSSIQLFCIIIKIKISKKLVKFTAKCCINTLFFRFLST